MQAAQLSARHAGRPAVRTPCRPHSCPYAMQAAQLSAGHAGRPGRPYAM